MSTGQQSMRRMWIVASSAPWPAARTDKNSAQMQRAAIALLMALIISTAECWDPGDPVGGENRLIERPDGPDQRPSGSSAAPSRPKHALDKGGIPSQALLCLPWAASCASVQTTSRCWWLPTIRTMPSPGTPAGRVGVQHLCLPLLGLRPLLQSAGSSHSHTLRTLPRPHFLPTEMYHRRHLWTSEGSLTALLTRAPHSVSFLFLSYSGRF